MPRYTKLFKKTARGLMQRQIALDGKTLAVRENLGVSKKTGRAAGAFSTRKTTFRSEAAARTAFDKAMAEAAAEGFRADEKSGSRPSAPKRKSAPSSKARRTPAAALATFERAHGCKLPGSYRRFVMRNGACDLGGGFLRLAAPGRRDTRALERLVRLARGLADDFPDEPRAPLLARSIAFADTVAGDLLVFDTRDASAEPAVYLLPRNSDRAKKLARSFAELVERVTGDAKFVGRHFGVDANEHIVHR